MIFELYIFLQVLMVTTFFVAFFTKQEVLWVITAVLSGALMITSYNVEFARYAYDAVLGAYTYGWTTQSMPTMMAINMVFFVLALLMGMFDIFDKYGLSLSTITEKFK